MCTVVIILLILIVRWLFSAQLQLSNIDFAVYCTDVLTFKGKICLMVTT